MKPISICFATPGVWPLLSGHPTVYGGSELRALAFMTALARQPEWTLSLIVFVAEPARLALPVRIVPDRHHAGRDRLFDRLCDLFRPSVSDPASPSTSGESRAWWQADAMIYVAFGVAEYTAKLAAWCRRNGRRLVLVAGSDSDFDEHYRADDAGMNSYGSRNALCRYALDHAGAIVCQTDTQARLLQQHFGRSGTVVRNPVELGEVRVGARRHAIWLGKTDNVKRPELFVTLAKLCPNVPCLLVANPTDRDRYRSLCEMAPANLTIRESVPRDQLDALLADSFCVVNTSVFEGFPNAFLDAGRQAVPVLSLAVDPDGALVASGGGAVAGGDLIALASFVRRAHADPDQARAMGQRWHAHVKANHEAEAQFRVFADVLRRVAASLARHAA